MMANLFDQFTLPRALGINIALMTMLFPMLLSPLTSNRLYTDRTTALMKWAYKKAAQHFTSMIPPAGQNWAMVLVSMFFLLTTLNIIGLLPYTFTPTSHLSVNFALAFPMWLGTVLTGMAKKPNEVLAHLLPTGTPTPLIPILVAIEFISLMMRPLALGIRLTANITSGHLLLHLISAASHATMNMAPTITMLPTALLIMLTVLEIAVATIQAYVFTMLLCLYLEENTYD